MEKTIGTQALNKEEEEEYKNQRDEEMKTVVGMRVTFDQVNVTIIKPNLVTTSQATMLLWSRTSLLIVKGLSLQSPTTVRNFHGVEIDLKINHYT